MKINVLETMSHAAYGKDDYEVMTGQMPEGYAYGGAAGCAFGGYKLLRSEYRHDNPDNRLDTAVKWLGAIWNVVMHLLPDTQQIPDDIQGYLLYPDDQPYGPEVTLYDLYYNGDIEIEDIAVFAEVLRRYVHLKMVWAELRGDE